MPTLKAHLKISKEHYSSSVRRLFWGNHSLALDTIPSDSFNSLKVPHLIFIIFFKKYSNIGLPRSPFFLISSSKYPLTILSISSGIHLTEFFFFYKKDNMVDNLKKKKTSHWSPKNDHLFFRRITSFWNFILNIYWIY